MSFFSFHSFYLENFTMSKTTLLAAALAAAFLAGCSSTPKTDPAIAGDGAAGAGGAASDVAQVRTDDGSAGLDAKGGPAGVGRVSYFDFDSYVVRSDEQPTVEAHARHLQTNTGRSVVLEGHTDVRGSREYNLALGQKRAEAVRRAMTMMGASDAQLEAVSMGEESPAAFGNSEDDHAQNRRVEIRYR